MKEDIYTQFKTLLDKKDNSKIIFFIEETQNVEYFIHSFLSFSCKYNNIIVVMYILKNYDIHDLENSIFKSIQYGHNKIVSLLFKFAKNKENNYKYITNSIDFYLNFIEQCILYSNTLAIPLITKFYLKKEQDFLINLDYSMYKSLITSNLTEEQLDFILNYKHFMFSKKIQSLFFNLVLSNKINFCLIIFKNLKHLLIDIDKKIIINLIKNILINKKSEHNNYIIEMLDFFNLINYIEKNEKYNNSLLLEELNKIIFKNKIKHF